MENAQEKKFVFLAHWVENWNWWLWFAPILHRRPGLKILFFPLWPIAAIASLVYFFSRRAYDVVDRFGFGGIPGETWLVRAMAWSFMLGSGRQKIKQRILISVLDAQEAGASVIGLGALTKAEWLTQGGEWIVEKLGERLKIPVIHGDTLTAAAVIAQTLSAKNQYNIKNPVFITGATSKIGRAVALSLAQSGITVKLYTSSFERFLKIQEDAGAYGGRNLVYASSLIDGIDCHLWLTGKSKPRGIKLRWHIPKGAVVINFSVPNPLGERSFLNPLKWGITAFEGGLMKYDPESTDLKFTMRLEPGATYACHAGTIVHAAMDWKHHEVGQVELRQLQPALEAARQLGFDLLPLPKKKAMKIKEEKSSLTASNKEVV